jgi:hypothetical protein
MLETPSIRRYSPLAAAVTMRPVRTISRKGFAASAVRNPQRLYAELGGQAAVGMR